MVNILSSNDATQWKEGSQRFSSMEGVRLSHTTRRTLSGQKARVKNHRLKYAKQFFDIDSKFPQTQRNKWWELAHFKPSHAKNHKSKEFEKRFIRAISTNNDKRQLSKDQSNDDKIESTTLAGKVVDIADIGGSCQQIKWNINNENSNFVILTIESESNQYICSLSNAHLTSAYSHLCQYGEYSFCLPNYSIIKSSV